jgi:hypothetical protein
VKDAAADQIKAIPAMVRVDPQAVARVVTVRILRLKKKRGLWLRLRRIKASRFSL